MDKQAPKVFLSEAQIQARVTELAQQINQDYKNEPITIICTLKGSFIFCADLVRKLSMPVKIEFISASSYGNEKVSSGEVKLALDISEPILDKNVIVVEDIVDSGLTIQYILKILQVRNPKSIKCCALLYKPESLKTDVTVDYHGFSIGNDFVVGYGLDYAQNYRELPYVGVLDT